MIKSFTTFLKNLFGGTNVEEAAEDVRQLGEQHAGQLADAYFDGFFTKLQERQQQADEGFQQDRIKLIEQEPGQALPEPEELPDMEYLELLKLARSLDYAGASRARVDVERWLVRKLRQKQSAR